jgi:hypothetical protein
VKTINWAVILGLVVNVIANFLPDFPAEAATLAITNGIILVAYIIHKAKDRA